MKNIYRFEVKDENNLKFSDVGYFSNVKEMREQLKEKKYNILSFEKISGEELIEVKIGIKKIALFTKSLSLILTGGISFIDALSIIIEEEKNEKFKIILILIREKILSGISIEEAFSKFSNLFSNFYLTMISIGEINASLEDRLLDIYNVLEEDIKNRKKIKEALIYPSIIISFAFIVFIFLMLFILPRFITLFEENLNELPYITKILIKISLLFKYFIFTLVILITPLYFQLKKTIKEHRLKFDKLLFKVPFYGVILKKRIGIQISYELSLLINSGVELPIILKSLEKNISNLETQLKMKTASELIYAGNKISISFKAIDIFTKNHLTMIAIGEEGGSISQMLDLVSRLLREELEVYTKRNIMLIEPVIILVVGILIGVFVIGIYLPIFNMSNLI